MYYKSRRQAGQQLATKIVAEGIYNNQNCLILALDRGGFLVGQEIASALKAPISILLMENIEIPGEGLDFGGVTQGGHFSYSQVLSEGEIIDYISEYHSYLDASKQQVFQRLNRELASSDILPVEIIRNKNIILVNDSLISGYSVDLALSYLKTIKTKKITSVAVIVTQDAADRIRLLVDKIMYLDVRSNFISTDHYFDSNKIPSTKEIVEYIKKTIE